MPNVEYARTITDTLIDLLEQYLPGGFFKAFYYGDPFDIPTSVLPCVMVEKQNTRVTHGPTGMDRVETSLFIKLAYNMKEDFGKRPDEVLGVRKLEEFAEAIDNSSGEYAATSIMGILRKYFTMGNVVLDQTHLIRYGLTERPKDLLRECQIQVSFLQLRTVTGRV